MHGAAASRLAEAPPRRQSRPRRGRTARERRRRPGDASRTQVGAPPNRRGQTSPQSASRASHLAPARPRAVSRAVGVAAQWASVDGGSRRSPAQRVSRAGAWSRLRCRGRAAATRRIAGQVAAAHRRSREMVRPRRGASCRARTSPAERSTRVAAPPRGGRPDGARHVGVLRVLAMSAGTAAVAPGVADPSLVGLPALRVAGPLRQASARGRLHSASLAGHRPDAAVLVPVSAGAAERCGRAPTRS